MSIKGIPGRQSEHVVHHENPAGGTLAIDMLERLRRQVVDETTVAVDLDELGAEGSERRTLDPRVPVHLAAYTIALAHGLAPHFPDWQSLARTTSLVVIRGRTGDDAEVMGNVLAAAFAAECNVAVNPRHGLVNGDQVVIIPNVIAYDAHAVARAVSQAGARCLPTFCTMLAKEALFSELKGADLVVDLPLMTTAMLGQLFEAVHDEVPEGVTSLAWAEKLTVQDLVAHIRRSRPAAQCLAGLRASVTPAKAEGPKTILLDDLAGYGQAKTWGLELAQDMKLWQERRLGWNEVDHRAVVLSGVPGTGKTSFGAVLAATLQVPLIATSVAEWNSRDHLAGALKRMQAVFGEAIAQAPAVLFIDELDGISNRDAIGGRYSEYWTQIVNRMLELVTNALATEGLVIVGATNHVSRIDPALTRSGRLDQVITIDLPDAEAIALILERYAASQVPRNELFRLAPQLVGSSGADIERLVRAAKATARRAGRPFLIEDLYAQVPDPLRGILPSTRRRIGVYRNGQRIVAQVLGLADMVLEEPNTGLRQLLEKGLSNERFPTEQLCNDVLTVILAGRAAEEVVFGDVSVFGAGHPQSDLASATAVAVEMETRAGFGEVGLVYLDQLSSAAGLTTAVTTSVRRRLEGALSRASAILLENVGELERLSEQSSRKSASSADHLRLLN